MIKLMFQKKLTLIKQVNQKDLCFVIIGILKTSVMKFQPYLCNVCHAVSMTAYELKNIAILNRKDVNYRFILWGIIKSDADDRLKNNKKMKVFYKKILVWCL